MNSDASLERDARGVDCRKALNGSEEGRGGDNRSAKLGGGEKSTTFFAGEDCSFPAKVRGSARRQKPEPCDFTLAGSAQTATSLD